MRVKDQEQLPSGTQIVDVMTAVHEKIWRTTKDSMETIPLAKYKLRGEGGENIELAYGTEYSNA